MNLIIQFLTSKFLSTVAHRKLTYMCFVYMDHLQCLLFLQAYRKALNLMIYFSETLSTSLLSHGLHAKLASDAEYNRI